MIATNFSSTRFLRYPGGKGRFLSALADFIPENHHITGKYIEPFLGGGSVFFFINPEQAVLSDINAELIDLYRGIQADPTKVWDIYRNFPSTKAGYYQVRTQKPQVLSLTERAARLLFLNRTCFKGMWRHNASGEFTVGYGGQDRRWVVNQSSLAEISAKLQHAELLTDDFEKVINSSNDGDFLFLDPPYKPGERELREAHYSYGKFTFEEQSRLCAALKRASNRGVRWVMTNSAHTDIVDLYRNYNVIQLGRGVGGNIGQITSTENEVIICSQLET